MALLDFTVHYNRAWCLLHGTSLAKLLNPTETGLAYNPGITPIMA